MKTPSTVPQAGALSRTFRATFIGALLPALLLLLTIQSGHAGSATWSSNPGDENLWASSVNWVPQTVPDGPNDTATFATSSVTYVDIDMVNDFSRTVDGINFVPGADAFTIQVNSASLHFAGVGITNDSGITQNFLANGIKGGSKFYFDGTSTAGSLTAFTMLGGSNITRGYFGIVYFNDQSSAASGSFTLQGGSGNNRFGAEAFFSSTSTLDHASFTVDGGLHGARGGLLSLANSANAAQSTLIANGGTRSSAGGIISFKDDSLGGEARVLVYGNGELERTLGELDISAHNPPGATIGGLEGNGLVFLGANSLTVGANNLTSVFSGVIQDGGASGGTGGSLVKSGKDTLTLSGANTYTGGTTVSQGTLSIGNLTGSATGTGAVQVNHGTLAGTGAISGAVTVGATSGASLAPGTTGTTGTLSVASSLTFGFRASYKADLNSTTVRAEEVTAFGVTISSGARIAIDDLGSGTLAPGTVFTVISNTAATAIAGTFSNLADNSALTVGSNTYLVSYEGGDGNDLTLTVQ
jgi:autotransporter-associated beta strand protein